MIDIDREYAEGKRVSPLTILYSAIQKLPAIAISIYVITSQNQKAEILNLVIYLFIFLFTVPSIFISYFFFKFSVTPRFVSIKRGFIARLDRSIPIERIQNVNVIQNFLHRILGIAHVEIETAGDAGTEANLQFVTKKDAEYIKDLILRYKDTALPHEEQSDSSTTEARNNIIYQMSPSETAIFGITRFRPLVLIFGFWIYSLLQQLYLAEGVEQSFGAFFNKFASLNLLGRLAYILIAFLVILLSSWLLDLLLAYVTYSNYKLEQIGNKLNSTFGLITKRIITLPLKKIQSIQISTNIIRKWIGYYSLNISTAGIGLKSKPTETAVPLSHFDTIKSIGKKFTPFEYPENFIKSSYRSIILRFISNSIRLSIVIVILYNFFTNAIYYGLLTLPFIYLDAYLKWKARGYWINDNHIFIKHGYIAEKITIIPFEKLQTMHYSANFWQRLFGIGSVHPDTASLPSVADSTIENIKIHDALEVFDLISKKII